MLPGKHSAAAFADWFGCSSYQTVTGTLSVSGELGPKTHELDQIRAESRTRMLLFETRALTCGVTYACPSPLSLTITVLLEHHAITLLNKSCTAGFT